MKKPILVILLTALLCIAGKIIHKKFITSNPPMDLIYPLSDTISCIPEYHYQDPQPLLFKLIPVQFEFAQLVSETELLKQAYQQTGIDEFRIKGNKKLRQCRMLDKQRKIIADSIDLIIKQNKMYHE